MARPTKLTQEMITAAQEYIESCIDSPGEWVSHEDDEGKKHTKFVPGLRVKIPTIEGLAVRLKVARSTVYLWKEKPDESVAKDSEGKINLDKYDEIVELHEKFSDIIEQLLSIQAERLLNNGLSGTYNSTIAKVLLSGKHGYIEKKSTDITTGGDKLVAAPLIVSEIGKEEV